MADYPELSVRDIRIDTSFGNRPQSGGRDFLTADPMPRDRYSRHSNQTQPRLRDVTWISTSQSQLPSAHTHPHTPQTPRYIPPPSFQVQQQQPRTRTPTPVLRKSEPTITDSEIEAEYMTVSVDERDDCNYGGHGYGFSEVMLTTTTTAMNGKSEKKNFVGGFVNGLRRLPKVMSKGRLRDRDRQGTGTTVSTLPRYTPGPSALGVPMSNSDDIPTVERLETPPRASSVSPRPRHVNPADGETSIGDARRERLMLSAVREHSYEHSLHPSLHLPRAHSRSDDTSSSSQPFERGGEGPHAMSTPILADASIRLSSPILAEPRPSADFKKMESPIRPPPAESVRSQIVRARKFVRDLGNLPWIASSGVSNIYVPGEATSRRYSRPIAKQNGSWYTPRAKPIDLLAGPSTTGLLGAHQPVAVHHHTPVVPPPFILGSSANLLFTQPGPMGVGVGVGMGVGGGGGGSGSLPSHEGSPSTDSHGSQGQVLAPAYIAQPLFVYPSGLPQPGGPPEAAYPRPVYMLANSPPQFFSPSQDGGMPQRVCVPQPSGLRMPAFG